MTTRKRNTKLSAVEAVSGDRDLMKALLKEALEEVLEGEMTEFLGAAPGERAEGRNGYRAGYYGRNLITRIGKLELRVPRDRSGEFSTALFERYARSEKALVAALAEMYVQGVSTRKVKAITEALCGHSFSASAISAINKQIGRKLLIIWDGLKAHRSRLVRDYVDSLDGRIELAFLPPYAPNLNPVEYLWAWLKRHALANYCPNSIDALATTARGKLKSAQRRTTLIAACWKQADLF
jgi:transposase